MAGRECEITALVIFAYQNVLTSCHKAESLTIIKALMTANWISLTSFGEQGFVSAALKFAKPHDASQSYLQSIQYLALTFKVQLIALVCRYLIRLIQLCCIRSGCLWNMLMCECFLMHIQVGPWKGLWRKGLVKKLQLFMTLFC